MDSGSNSGITELSFDDSGPVRKVYEKYAKLIEEKIDSRNPVEPNEILALTEMYRSIEAYKKHNNPFNSSIS
ncbi:hypothetical protein [Dyadobacter sp. CY312]|uniref:hypothetical protein n=1 Tax=Dyadobacter sp. CY312 TaxID=2907303 RepID=UPI001F1DBB3B|nr:hypothetical protein [Dyadobacter sp. CY312]MCE7039194.1 hypothetical protein [Dyadobacter sp. CY312]